jgi:hypothetical protein
MQMDKARSTQCNIILLNQTSATKAMLCNKSLDWTPTQKADNCISTGFLKSSTSSRAYTLDFTKRKIQN